MQDEGNNWLTICSFLSCNFIDKQKFRNVGHKKIVYECYSNSDIKDTILAWLEIYFSKNEPAEKCVEQSSKLRDLGNKMYAKDVEGSLKLYTRSIIYAPHKSRELLLALGNRSAASFRLHNYKNCIEDIDLAVKTFNDEIVITKLLTRKEDALKELKISGAEQSLPVNPEHALLAHKNCRPSEISHQLPVVSRGINESLPFASSVLALEVDSLDSTNQRRVIARENIEIGEVLYVEDPFTFVLLPDYFLEYCQLCCKELKCPIACSDCNDFLFCNQKCYKLAHESFHKWECFGSRLLRDTGVGFLALRTVLKASQNPFDFHYEQVNDLETHLDDVPIDDLISYALTATMLLLYLEKYTNYFTHSSVRKSFDGVGFRLLKHMIQIICNAFAGKKSYFNIEQDEYSLDTSLTTFSTGLYPSAAMMNHSCDPNIITSFLNNILVVRAGQQIIKGDEVFNSYGPHYRHVGVDQRKEILKNQFYFDCKCRQCSLPEKKRTNFLCLECKSSCLLENDLRLKCTSCGKIINLDQYQKLKKRSEEIKEIGFSHMRQGNYQEALAAFEGEYTYLVSFLCFPSPEVEICSANIASCCQYLGSWKHIGERAKRMKICCGEYSLQYGEFLRDLLSVYLRDLSRTKSSICCRTKSSICCFLAGEALSNLVQEFELIILFNFGSWSLEYSYVKDLKNSLQKYQL